MRDLHDPYLRPDDFDDAEELQFEPWPRRRFWLRVASVHSALLLVLIAAGVIGLIVR